MTEFEQMDESERLQFTEFKRNLNRQAAQAQVGKIEYELTDASVIEIFSNVYVRTQTRLNSVLYARCLAT